MFHDLIRGTIVEYFTDIEIGISVWWTVSNIKMCVCIYIYIYISLNHDANFNMDILLSITLRYTVQFVQQGDTYSLVHKIGGGGHSVEEWGFK